MNHALKNTRSQAGFTLVELAIVMIIIGLLIAGVLKGQQLIGNAKVTAQVAQVKAIDAATSTFRDMYTGMPGDILTPATRLPNCAGVCAQAGNANGSLTLAPGTAMAAGSENATFFPQLSAADLMTGINQANAVTWGGQFPAAKINGGLDIGSSVGNVALAVGLACIMHRLDGYAMHAAAFA